MTKSKRFFSTFAAFVAAACCPLAASSGIDEDFSSSAEGTTFDHVPLSNAGGWAWSAAHPTLDEGVVEIVEETGTPKFLRIDLPFPESAAGHWRLLCELDNPIDISSANDIKLQTVLRIPDLNFPMDFVVGLVGPDRNNPLSLGPEDFQTLFRFMVSPAAGRSQLYYTSWPEGSGDESLNYVTALPFEVVEGEWYQITVEIKPHQQTYDLLVQTTDGTTLFEASGIAWASNFSSIDGLAFKNRTTNDLRSAKFQLRSVALKAADQ
jgi:hypothetical protein